MHPVSIGISVPLFNENDLLTSVVADLRDALDRCGVPWHLALVNNGSTDATGDTLDRIAHGDPRLIPLHLSANAGYGGGILHGLHALRERVKPPFIGWAWGDGQVDPGVLPALLELCRDGADLAKVRRRTRLDGRRRRAITRTYGLATRALGIRTPDVNGCPKVFRSSALWALNPQSQDWFLDPEVVFRLEAQGGTIAQVDATMRPRQGGQSKVNWRTVAEFSLALARWSQGWRPSSQSVDAGNA